MQSWLQLAAEGQGPLSHVLDKEVLGGLWMHSITLVIGATLCVVALLAAARAIETGPETKGNERYLTRGRLSQMIEVIVLYLMDAVIRPQLGHSANRFAPYLLTLFFFILFNNLLGLVPLLDLQHLIGHYALGDTHFAVLGGTATGNIAVTFALAIIAFIVIQVSGIRSGGVKGWLMHLTAGSPWYLWPIMIPVEILGTFIKPAALAIRLFANMTAGHVLLAVLIGFTGMFLATKVYDDAGRWVTNDYNFLVGVPVGLVAVVGAVAIMMLELFVAFLQAFIFMFLTTLFIAQMMHHEHDEHHEGEEYDVDHPMKDDKSVPVSAV